MWLHVLLTGCWGEYPPPWSHLGGHSTPEPSPPIGRESWQTSAPPPPPSPLSEQLDSRASVHCSKYSAVVSCQCLFLSAFTFLCRVLYNDCVNSCHRTKVHTVLWYNLTFHSNTNDADITVQYWYKCTLHWLTPYISSLSLRPYSTLSIMMMTLTHWASILRFLKLVG